MSDIPARFRKRPLEVFAVQWTGGNGVTVAPFIEASNGAYRILNGELHLWITKSEAWTVVPVGDWVLAERDGDGCYRCTATEFDDTYEPVE